MASGLRLDRGPMGLQRGDSMAQAQDRETILMGAMDLGTQAGVPQRNLVKLRVIGLCQIT